MRKCACGGKMEELTGKTPESISYQYYKCEKCGEEILDTKELKELTLKYRQLKSYQATISQWGQSLGLRIPKELADRYKLKDSEKVTIIPEKEGVKILF